MPSASRPVTETAAGAGPWLAAPPRASAALRLFCFPYAGGNAHIFRDWPSRLPAAIDVCPVMLPGRGARFREPCVGRMGPLVDALAAGLGPHLDRPFAFFGHSMGALIAFELALTVQARYGRYPARVIVSARRAADMAPERKTYDLPEPELLDELSGIRATPRELLANPEAMTLLLPIVRADFELVHTYRCAPGAMLDCGIDAFGGTSDESTPREALARWQNLTTGGFTLTMIAGDHFFIDRAASEFFPRLSDALLAAVRNATPLR